MVIKVVETLSKERIKMIKRRRLKKSYLKMSLIRIYTMAEMNTR